MKKSISVLCLVILVFCILTAPAWAANPEFIVDGLSVCPQSMKCHTVDIQEDSLLVIKENDTLQVKEGLLLNGKSSMIVNGRLEGSISKLDMNGDIFIGEKGSVHIETGDRMTAQQLAAALKKNGANVTLDGNTVEAMMCKHITALHGVVNAEICADCGEVIFYESNPIISASTISEGSLAIVCAIAGIAVGFVIAALIFKRKKKPLMAEGIEKEE